MQRHSGSNLTFTLHASINGSHWLCMGHSQNALWVHPFCQLRGLREKFRNVKTFPAATDPANQIAVMQIHTLLGLWPMKNRICDTTRENTWICCGKSRPAAGDLKMDEKDIMAVGNQPILFDQFLYRPEPDVGSRVTGYQVTELFSSFWIYVLIYIWSC